MLTEGPCLTPYAKHEDDIVTTDASTIGLRITLLQKQDDGNTKPRTYGNRNLNDTEKNISISELELLVVVGEPLVKINRSNKQYNARVTTWLDRL